MIHQYFEGRIQVFPLPFHQVCSLSSQSPPSSLPTFINVTLSKTTDAPSIVLTDSLSITEPVDSLMDEPNISTEAPMTEIRQKRRKTSTMNNICCHSAVIKEVIIIMIMCRRRMAMHDFKEEKVIRVLCS